MSCMGSMMASSHDNVWRQLAVLRGRHKAYRYYNISLGIGVDGMGSDLKAGLARLDRTYCTEPPKVRVRMYWM